MEERPNYTFTEEGVKKNPVNWRPVVIMCPMYKVLETEQAAERIFGGTWTAAAGLCINLNKSELMVFCCGFPRSNLMLEVQ